MSIRETMALAPGSVVSLKKPAGEPVDLLVNGRPIARGEVVTIDEEFGLRITELIGQGQGAELGLAGRRGADARSTRLARPPMTSA